MLAGFTRFSFCLGALYTVWFMWAGVPRLPYEAFGMMACSAVILYLLPRRPEHTIMMSVQACVVFYALTYASLHENGIYSSALWWMSIPLLCALLGGSRMVATVMFACFLLLVSYLYVHGPPSRSTVSFTSPLYPQAQTLLAVLLSTSSVAAIMAFATRTYAAMHRALEDARRRDVDALQAKALFMMRMSQELKVPLLSLDSAASLLRTGVVPDSQLKQLYAVVHHSERMLQALSADLSHVSRLDASTPQTTLTIGNLRKVLFQLIELHSVQCVDKGIDMTFSYDQDSPKTANADHHHIRQVVNGFVSNAIAATSAGGVHVHLSTDKAPQAGDPARRALVRIDVVATPATPGRSVAAAPASTPAGRRAIQERLAESHDARLSLAASTELASMLGGSVEVSQDGFSYSLIVPVDVVDFGDRAQPTGLRAVVATRTPGMAQQMKSLLAAHGVSCVSVEEVPTVRSTLLARATMAFIDAALVEETHAAKSQLDQLAGNGVKVALLSPLGSDTLVGAAAGTTLIYKPVRRSSVADFVSGAFGDGHVAKTPVEVAPRGSPAWLRVLVADDQVVNQVVAEAMLLNLHCEVELVQNGADALEALQRRKFDAVLMDVRMPFMDGLEATRRWRTIESELGLARTPIIAMTGLSDDEAAPACLEAGMDSFLAKPFGLPLLRSTLESVSPPAAVRATP